jgi:hypothetical protein
MRLLSLLLCFFLIQSVSAQLSLKGRIVSADTHQPVANASVFLSSTSVGTSTNAEGEFELKPFPPGRYELVVSCIGYETLRKEIFSNKLPELLELTVQPRINELKEVVVETYVKDGWDKWGNLFLDNFIGTTDFARDCRILNKEVVRFRYNSKTNVIRASSEEPILIENNALGYLLKYSLTRFEFNLSTRGFLIAGHPFFEEMQSTSRNKVKRWLNNREEAYYGSLLHFMRSLYRNKLVEQKFEVRSIRSVSPEERERVEFRYKLYKKETEANRKRGALLAVVIPADTVPLLIDTAAYYASVVNNPNSRRVAVDLLLTADSIAFAVDSFRVGMYFPGSVQIIYRPKKMPAVGAQVMFSRNVYSNSPATSEMQMLSERPVFVMMDGTFYEGTDIMLTGFFAIWEKMCNKLPFNYWPPPPVPKK